MNVLNSKNPKILLYNINLNKHNVMCLYRSDTDDNANKQVGEYKVSNENEDHSEDSCSWGQLV